MLQAPPTAISALYGGFSGRYAADMKIFKRKGNQITEESSGNFHPSGDLQPGKFSKAGTTHESIPDGKVALLFGYPKIDTGGPPAKEVEKDNLQAQLRLFHQIEKHTITEECWDNKGSWRRGETIQDVMWKSSIAAIDSKAHGQLSLRVYYQHEGGMIYEKIKKNGQWQNATPLVEAKHLTSIAAVQWESAEDETIALYYTDVNEVLREHRFYMGGWHPGHHFEGFKAPGAISACTWHMVDRQIRVYAQKEDLEVVEWYPTDQGWVQGGFKKRVSGPTSISATARIVGHAPFLSVFLGYEENGAIGVSSFYDSDWSPIRQIS